MTLTRGVATDIMRGALYMPRDAAAVLYLVRQAADGDFAPLLAQQVRTASVTTDDMALGATMAVLCSEDVPSVAAIDLPRRRPDRCSAPPMRTSGAPLCRLAGRPCPAGIPGDHQPGAGTDLVGRRTIPSRRHARAS